VSSRRLVRAVVLAAAASALAAGSAHAAPTAEVGIADDRLLFGDPGRAAQVVQEWKAIGIERARVFARWIVAAPAPHDISPPTGFRAADHTDPNYNWGALDRVVDLLVAAGIHPVLTVTGSGPLWSSREPQLGNPRFKPDPHKFAEFAYAVARRYGDRVDRYILWNEPNQPGWLQPQFTCAQTPSGLRPGTPKKKCTPASPHIYRALVRAAQPSIQAADPGAEVLIGALAPRGGRPVRRNVAMRPLTFIRALGCVDDRYRRVRKGPCRGFQPAAGHGFAYHPHGVLRGPATPNPQPDEAALADLPRLKTALDKVTAAGGFRPRDGARFPLYLTEFGYQTRPPDPYAGVEPKVQARWLQQAAYVAWSDPRVKCLMQYEWEDEPIASKGLGAKAFAGWQSGLMYTSGQPKPALAAFRNPFWIAVTPKRFMATFWGQVRPSADHTVTLFTRASSGSPWRPLGIIRTDARGYWSKRIPVLTSADYRYTYTVPSGDPYLGPITERSSTLRVRARVGVLPPR
jgi:hypothetical protein